MNSSDRKFYNHFKSDENKNMCTYDCDFGRCLQVICPSELVVITESIEVREQSVNYRPQKGSMVHNLKITLWFQCFSLILWSFVSLLLCFKSSLDGKLLVRIKTKKNITVSISNERVIGSILFRPPSLVSKNLLWPPGARAIFLHSKVLNNNI